MINDVYYREFIPVETTIYDNENWYESGENYYFLDGWSNNRCW